MVVDNVAQLVKSWCCTKRQRVSLTIAQSWQNKQRQSGGEGPAGRQRVARMLQSAAALQYSRYPMPRTCSLQQARQRWVQTLRRRCGQLRGYTDTEGAGVLCCVVSAALLGALAFHRAFCAPAPPQCTGQGMIALALSSLRPSRPTLSCASRTREQIANLFAFLQH